MAQAFPGHPAAERADVDFQRRQVEFPDATQLFLINAVGHSDLDQHGSRPLLAAVGVFYQFFKGPIKPGFGKPVDIGPWLAQGADDVGDDAALALLQLGVFQWQRRGCCHPLHAKRVVLPFAAEFVRCVADHFDIEAGRRDL